MENNKLIAEFMGYEFTETPTCGILGGNKFTKYPKKDNKPPFVVHYGWQFPNYNKSWDKLMLVIEKIENLGYIFKIDTKMSSVSRNNKDNEDSYLVKAKFGDETKLQKTYICVVESIKYINKNK